MDHQDQANVAYGHSIFKTGYRYNGRALGFSGDGDTLVLLDGLNAGTILGS